MTPLAHIVYLNSDATGTLIAFEALTAMLVHRDVGFYSRLAISVDWRFL